MSRPERPTALLIALGLVGMVIAAYLTLFELGAIKQAWDPVFGDGSERVLRSLPARALPVPDALLGMLGYGLEVVLLIGMVASAAPRRRRLTIALGGVAAIALLASIGLVALQAVVIGAWCFLCLASAAISCLVAAIAIPDAATELAAGREPRRIEKARRGLHAPRPSRH
jgi:uncharacterized membrane protein